MAFRSVLRSAYQARGSLTSVAPTIRAYSAVVSTDELQKMGARVGAAVNDDVAQAIYAAAKMELEGAVIKPKKYDIPLEAAKEFCKTLTLPMVDGEAAVDAELKSMVATFKAGDRSKFPTIDEVDVVARKVFDVAEKKYALNGEGTPLEFLTYKKTFLELGSKLPKEPEKIDWEYWRGALPDFQYWDDLEAACKEDQAAILNGSKARPAIDHLLSDLAVIEQDEAEFQAQMGELKSCLETLFTSLDKIDEFEAKLQGMTVNEILDKFPTLKAEVDEKVKNEEWF